MANKISRRKLIKGYLKEIERIGGLLSETDPNDSKYDDLLKKQRALIESYDKLKSHSISADTALKTITSLTQFGACLAYESNHVFTFETVRNFLRKPKP